MTDFSKVLETIEARNSELLLIQKKYQKELAAEFKVATQFFFEETPVKAIVWNQYTPYWNDGEECTFRVDEVYFVTSDLTEEQIDDICSAYDVEDDEQYTTVNSYDKSELADVCIKFSRLIEYNSHLMKEVFGDHALVILTKDASTVKEYEHE